MMQKKPNRELAQAVVDSLPPSIVYRPHPKKKDHLQSFTPTFTIDDQARRLIDLGKPLATFKKCDEGEKADALVYDAVSERIVKYKKV